MEYYHEALSFCSWAEKLTSITDENAPAVIQKLMKIYQVTSALSLPDSTETFPTSDEYIILPFTVPHGDVYWLVHDPYICEDPACGSLKDDITSIYNDIRRGVLAYEAGFLLAAQWEWKWNFEHHWKYHAVDAIRALNSIKDGEKSYEHGILRED